MSGPAAAKQFFIGWDVGGWNCDRNRSSRDAIVILDTERRIVGTPWRGNLRQAIASAAETRDWVENLFRLCRTEPPGESFRAILAIDTPLGFPADFIRLVCDGEWVEPGNDSGANEYLFRRTERRLRDAGRSPLSAIKDMIGSQATKGMHAVAKFAPVVERCGVWTDGQWLVAFETYPAACRETPTVQALLRGCPQLKPDDCRDALICALIAYVFATNPGDLEPPERDAPPGEGWIWLPSESYRKASS